MRITKKISNSVAALILIALFPRWLLRRLSSARRPAGPVHKGRSCQSKAPVNKNVLKVKLPRAEEATLPNGLRVVLLRSTKVPTFNMQMVVLSGGLSDKPDYRGLASSTVVVARRHAKRTSKDIAEQVDAIGATLFAGSGLSAMTSTVSIAGLVENLDPSLELFADVIRNPIFPQTEIDKYKTRTLAQLQFSGPFRSFWRRSSSSAQSMATTTRLR